MKTITKTFTNETTPCKICITKPICISKYRQYILSEAQPTYTSLVMKCYPVQIFLKEIFNQLTIYLTSFEFFSISSSNNQTKNNNKNKIIATKINKIILFFFIWIYHK
jgi:hypothetical protein